MADEFEHISTFNTQDRRLAQLRDIPLKDSLVRRLNSVHDTLVQQGEISSVKEVRDWWRNINIWKYCFRVKNYLGSGYDVVCMPTGTPLYRGIYVHDCDSVHPPHSIEDNYQQLPLWGGDLSVAEQYGEHIYLYRTSRPLVLFDLLNTGNIDVLTRKISHDIRSSPRKISHKWVGEKVRNLDTLQMTTGIGISLNEQAQLFQRYNIDDFLGFNHTENATQFNRVSIPSLDVRLTEVLKTEIPFVDGYYGQTVMSAYYPAPFHAEICLLSSIGRLYLHDKRCADSLSGGNPPSALAKALTIGRTPPKLRLALLQRRSKTVSHKKRVAQLTGQLSSQVYNNIDADTLRDYIRQC